MKTYNVIESITRKTGESLPLSSYQVQSDSAWHALITQWPGIPAMQAPDEDIAEWIGPSREDGSYRSIVAEPAEDPTQTEQYGSLREAIARAVVADDLAQAALDELARVAGVETAQAAAGLCAVAEWIPGEPLTDSQCLAFGQAAAADPEPQPAYQDLMDAAASLIQHLEDASETKDADGNEFKDVAELRAALNALGVHSV